MSAAPISGELLPCLDQLRQSSGLVFTGRNHDTWYKLLQTAMRKCGLPPGRLHDFRHTFGATLAQAGVSLGTIKELMGHADTKTTMIYVHFAPKHLREAVSKLAF